MHAYKDWYDGESEKISTLALHLNKALEGKVTTVKWQSVTTFGPPKPFRLPPASTKRAGREGKQKHPRRREVSSRIPTSSHSISVGWPPSLVRLQPSPPFSGDQDRGRDLHFTIYLQSLTLGFTPNPRMWSAMGYTGIVTGQNLPLDRTAKAPLDSKQEGSAQIVRPRARDNRPRHRLLLLFQASVVEHPSEAWRQRGTNWGWIHPGLVGIVATSLEWRQEERSGLPLHAGGMGAMERSAMRDVSARRHQPYHMCYWSFKT
jgi:hypothetical protein